MPFAVLLVVCLGVGAYFYYNYKSRVYEKCAVELGTEVMITTFQNKFIIMSDHKYIFPEMNVSSEVRIERREHIQ